eukprot:8622308-Alexandrium_andersonii.AAC.1
MVCTSSQTALPMVFGDLQRSPKVSWSLERSPEALRKPPKVSRGILYVSGGPRRSPEALRTLSEDPRRSSETKVFGGRG